MIAVEEMSSGQIREVLKRVGYGHLGMSRGVYPYVVPIHYAYADPDVYIYTTEGKKTEILKSNPEVCLQIEEMNSEADWASVIVSGEAVKLRKKADRERALEFILAVNPTLTPAVSIRWMDSWVRENIEAIYKITPRMMTGRATIDYGQAHPEVAAERKRRKATIY